MRQDGGSRAAGSDRLAEPLVQSGSDRSGHESIDLAIRNILVIRAHDAELYAIIDAKCVKRKFLDVLVYE